MKPSNSGEPHGRGQSAGGRQHYRWEGQHCAYRVIGELDGAVPPLLSLHPIGVGLSGAFWDRFDAVWVRRGLPHPLVHPDLLGCGDSELPSRAIRSEDWAEQIAHLWRQRINRPVVLLVQGASLPIALELSARLPEAVSGMVLAGPPSWRLISEPGNPQLADGLWRWFFSTGAGALFYRYARSPGFLRSFSIKQLFDRPEDVDGEWLSMLQAGSRAMATRYAVFSFLAGWWRRDYSDELQALRCPVLALFGEHASGISGRGKGDSPARKLEDYITHLPAAQGRLLPGRNVLPWEAPEPFVDAVAGWLAETRNQPDRSGPDS